VSWSCFQLESEILAELRPPSSGILNLSEVLPLPRDLIGPATYEKLAGSEDWNDVKHDEIIVYFRERVFLRKRLNEVQEQLYGSGCLEQSSTQIQQTLRDHKSILDRWRALLPDPLRRSSDCGPPESILSARWRADYWRTQYLISRPYLDYAIHIMQHVKAGGFVEAVALDAWRNPRDKNEINIFKAIELMGEGTVWAACESYVEVAMQGTVALCDVPKCVVMTDIHGIAHA